MQEILGACGFRCDLCPGYAGNLRSDTDRQRTSDGWFHHFGFRIPPEEIHCHGCGSGDCLDRECPVRPCAEAKGLATCASCDAFPCADLNTRMCFLDSRREEIARLEPGEYEAFYRPYEAKDRLARLRRERTGR